MRYNYWGAASDPGSRLHGKVKYNPYYTYDHCGIHDAKLTMSSESALPLKYALEQNYPNPFNPATTIQFSLPNDRQVRIEIFNVLGQRVRTFELGARPAGVHEVRWNGTSDNGSPLGSGLYFYCMRTPEYTQTRKMLLLR